MEGFWLRLGFVGGGTGRTAVRPYGGFYGFFVGWRHLAGWNCVVLAGLAGGLVGMTDGWGDGRWW